MRCLASAPLTRKAKSEVWYPHEGYIPVNLYILVPTLLDYITDEKIKDSFEQLCGLYLYLIQAKHESVNREMQVYHILHDPSSLRKQSGRGAAEQQQEKLRRLRIVNSFIHNFVRSMRKANFNPITQDQINFAANPEQILFGAPMSIDWDKLDSSIFEDYFASLKDDDCSPPPPFAEHCLVFWRGVGVQKQTDLFLLAKIDILVQKGFKLLRTALGPVLPARRSKKSGLATMAQEYYHMEDAAGSSKSPSNIHMPGHIQRKTLLNSAAHFWEKVTVEEPTYKEVILLFKKKDGDQGKQQPDKGRLSIQRYFDIPMKNLQVVFPVQKTMWNLADVVSFLMLLSFSITLAFKAFFAIANSTYIDEAVLGVLFLLFPLLLRWVNRKINSQRAHHQARVIAEESLRKNSLNCNAGVLSYIHDAAIEQDVKEALLAYFIIWQWGSGIRKKELDISIEHFLKTNASVLTLLL